MSVTFPSPALLALFGALVEDATGIHYGPDDGSLLAGKLLARVEQAGFDSPLDYYYLLKYDDPDRVELDALIDALVVPETYFFREFDALKLALAEFVVPLARENRRPRVWCAACATGEEPLTVCMMLAEAGVLGAVDVVASDVSLGVLRRARAGKFGLRTLRHVPEPDVAGRYIQRTDTGVTVREDITAAVDFRRVNLTSDAAVSALGTFDLVFCRNVLIYFTDATAAAVSNRIARVLRPGGALFVGVSESLIRLGTPLQCEERSGSFYYRRST